MEPIRAGIMLTCPTCGMQLVVITPGTDAVSCCSVALAPDSAKERGHAKPAG
jgi:hypothetical protein